MQQLYEQEDDLRCAQPPPPHSDARCDCSHRARPQTDDRPARLFERFVKRSLGAYGVSQSDFDQTVRRRFEGTTAEMHDFLTDMNCSKERRLKLAAAFAKLAIWRIDPGSMDWLKPRAHTLFLVAYDWRWRLLVKLTIAAFFLLTFFEAERTYPPADAGEAGTRPWSPWVAALEGMFVAIYAMDTGIALGFQRAGVILKQVSGRKIACCAG